MRNNPYNRNVGRKLVFRRSPRDGGTRGGALRHAYMAQCCTRNYARPGVLKFWTVEQGEGTLGGPRPARPHPREIGAPLVATRNRKVETGNLVDGLHDEKKNVVVGPITD